MVKKIVWNRHKDRHEWWETIHELFLFVAPRSTKTSKAKTPEPEVRRTEPPLVHYGTIHGDIASVHHGEEHAHVLTHVNFAIHSDSVEKHKRNRKKLPRNPRKIHA